MLLGFTECNSQKLVLPLGSLDILSHLVSALVQMVALVFKILDRVIVLVFNAKERVELSFEPF